MKIKLPQSILLPGDKPYINIGKPKRHFRKWGINHRVSSVETLCGANGERLTPGKHSMFKRYKWSPLYFKAIFQFMWGGLYRAIEGLRWWGYRDEEDELMRELDQYLNYLHEQNLYRIVIFEPRELLSRRDYLVLRGVPWGNYCNVPPQRGHSPKLYRTFKTSLDSKLYARINHMVNENYVDLEFFDKEAKKTRVIRQGIGEWKKTIKKLKKYRGYNPVPSVYERRRKKSTRYY